MKLSKGVLALVAAMSAGCATGAASTVAQKQSHGSADPTHGSADPTGVGIGGR